MNKIYLNAYTDASSYNNGKKNPTRPEHSASAGFILYDNIIIDSIYNFNPNSSISYGEMFAIYMVMKRVHKLAKKSKQEVYLTIYSDSAYACQSINIWSHNWRKHINQRGEWTNGSGDPVVYQDLLENILDNMDSKYLKVRLLHVSGHSEIKSKKDYDKYVKTFKRFNGFIPNLKEIKRHTIFNDIVDNYAKEVLNRGLRGKIEDERTGTIFKKYKSWEDSELDF